LLTICFNSSMNSGFGVGMAVPFCSKTAGLIA